MKRILCLLLAMLMAVSLFSACSSSSSDDDSEEEATSDTDTDTDEEDEDSDTSENPIEDETETVTITYYRSRINGNAITDYDDAAWVQELESRLNVDIVFEGPSSGDDYTEAVNIVLASNDLPELLYNNWNNYSGGLSGAVDDGIATVISDNEDYIALMPNWFGLLEENSSLYAAVTLDDGSVAQFCHVESDLMRSAYAGYAIRKDWLDTLGLEIPETVDELYEVLTAFYNEDANGNGDSTDEIPLTDTSSGNTLDYLMTAWTLRDATPYIDPATGNVTYWTELNDGENFKAFIQEMRKWYEEGLIDAEFASQDDDAEEAKITSDQAGFFFCYTAYFSTYTTALESYTGSDSIELYGMIPVTGDDGLAYTANDAAVRWGAANEGTVVTSTAVDNGTIETCLTLIDYLYSDEGTDLINWGVEGVSYEVEDDGTYSWTEAVTDNEEYSFNDAIFLYALPTWGSWPKIMSYDAWASVEVNEYSQEAHENYFAADTSLCIPSLMLGYDEAEEYNQIMTDAETLISETYINYILGNKTDEDVEDMLATLDSMGIADAIALYQDAYDSYLAKEEAGFGN